MIECLILGDSIATGISQHRPECVAYAKPGINTRDWNKLYLKNNISANTVIISLGSNDNKTIRTKAEFRRLREKVGVNSMVFWIMPANNPDIQELVDSIAIDYNDGVLVIPQVSKDGVHPTAKAYKQLANITK